MEKLDALKLYNLINEVLEKELLKIRNNAIANKDIKVPKESLIFLDLLTLQLTMPKNY